MPVDKSDSEWAGQPDVCSAAASEVAAFNRQLHSRSVCTEDGLTIAEHRRIV